jgi:hypothetical protein
LPYSTDMKRYLTLLVMATLCVASSTIHAEQPAASIEIRAAALAESLAAACPVAAYDSEIAFQACASALPDIQLPMQSAIARGGDQPTKQIKKKGLTHFSSQVFQTMYLPLFVFTGRWSLDEDKRSHSPIIRVEAFFRNRLAPDDSPYPFWHSQRQMARL